MQVTERYVRAHPTDDTMPGPVEEVADLDPARTAFVALHCWNIGFPGGPEVPRDYWVFMGSMENHRICVDVVNERIAPALRAARAAGLPVFHVQPQNVAEKHPGWDRLLDPAPAPAPTPRRSAIDGHLRARTERVHGPGFREWSGWSQVDIARAVYPQPGEQLVVTGPQFDRLLRERGIVNLVFTGFATNLCILDSPAAMKEMAAFGYRCLLIRECTLAVEFKDTVAERLNTKVASRYIEAWVGSTIGLDDYLCACAAVAAPSAAGEQARI